MLKAIDILLDVICIDIGEKELVQELALKRAVELETLFDRYQFVVNNSAADVRSVMAEFDKLFKDLNELLSYSEYSIHKKALEELLEYAMKYSNRNSLSKSLDTIFALVNEQRTKPRYEWIPYKSGRIGEIRIHNERWRVYFSGSGKKIIGFDYEHKTTNHRDIIPKLLSRING